MGETCFLLIKHIFYLLNIKNSLLPFSHLTVTQKSFHSFYLISFNNSLAANQRKGANYLIRSVLLLCDHKMLLTSSNMGIPVACHSDPGCSLPWPVLSQEEEDYLEPDLVLLMRKFSEGACPQLSAHKQWIQEGPADPGLVLLHDCHYMPHGPPKKECGFSPLKALLSIWVQIEQPQQQK